MLGAKFFQICHFLKCLFGGFCGLACHLKCSIFVGVVNLISRKSTIKKKQTKKQALKKIYCFHSNHEIS